MHVAYYISVQPQLHKQCRPMWDRLTGTIQYQVPNLANQSSRRWGVMYQKLEREATPYFRC